MNLNQENLNDYEHFCCCRVGFSGLTIGAKQACRCGEQCPLWTTVDGMEARDQQARREARRKALVELGNYHIEEIERMIASLPPKSKKERNKNTNIIVPAATAAAPYTIDHQVSPPLVAQQQRQPAVL